MKIAIIGAGAIGGYVGVKLALAGEDVTFIVRGANLEAIRNHGMKLIDHDGHEQVARGVKASNDYARRGRAGHRHPGDEGAPAGSGGR